ncbi:Elongation factor G 2 [Wickerhamomyces ciferrii]|uniref:Elongation factor G 2 n=1 Tax=Wickerhamomyces ciferrii (strain ATCC 14091 / BCRC 22168 / CBS 111 / JCM 3599 / NBRC 0793 / NRRL Y-1031 F-60-10) TaxID=1206466 RepID=K0K6E7_WICCF|nr:Elongation factor G 2 [Wickerhamomyces ciferrii]CCH40515.1 Elongation factor G 2 [Wickerhamomyces ciferrii]
MNHLNHSIPLVKSHSTTSYKNHFNPIAPAPINLAPKPTPISLAPKPQQGNNGQFSNDSSTITSLNSKNESLNNSNLDTQSLPCVITSKQWVLPPRPKAGRKPSEKQKKNQQNASRSVSQSVTQGVTQGASSVSSISMKSSQSQSNVSKLSSNLTGLNLYKSKSDLSNIEADSKSTSDLNLQNQLDNATEENQKLKNIISRLKQEIESLQTNSNSNLNKSQINSPNLLNNQPISQFDSLSNLNSEVSTPINPSNFNSREVSPSTIDPTKIQQEHLVKRTKRQYRKKKPTKKEQAAAAAAAAAQAQTQTQTSQVQQNIGQNTTGSSSTLHQQPIKPKPKQEIKIKNEFSPIPLPFIKKEESPSPISLNLDSEISSNLPNLESIITSTSNQQQQVQGTINDELSEIHELHHKKPKFIKLERSMSLQPEHLDSNFQNQTNPFKSIGLDRTMSIPMECNGLSRTTTNNTSLFDICEECGNENCYCLESGHIDNFNNKDNNDNNSINNNINNNNELSNNEYNEYNKNNDNEFDVNFFIKNEFEDDQFLMI